MTVRRPTGRDYAQLRIEARKDGWHRVFWPKLDLADWDLVSAHTWHIAWDGRTAYAQTQLTIEPGQDATLSMGRLIMGYGELGNLGRIDHLNGNGLDCRRANLRIATQSQLLAKRRPAGGTSRYKGVTWDAEQGKWLAAFRGRKVGRFVEETDAARAFDEAARAEWGDHAYLNFPLPPAVPMTGARARLLTFALDAALAAVELRDDPVLLEARERVQPWVSDSREWVRSTSQS